MKQLRILLLLFIFGSAQAMTVQVADAPTNNLELTVSAILSAKRTLLMNIYELTSSQIVDALIAQIKSGVQVQVLEEGGPVGGLSAAARGVQNQIVKAMRGRPGDHFFEMKANAGAKKRRFRYDHAKYIVIDGASLLIGSENYSPTGHPQPGSTGNRGWEVLVNDAALAAEFTEMFAKDSSTAFGDVADLTTNPPTSVLSCIGSGDGLFLPIAGVKVLEATAAEKIVSPDNSVAKVIASLESAKTSIDIQQMIFDSAWAGSASSPILDAVIAAAKRGVKVRVLLNDDSVFDHPGNTSVHKNEITVEKINEASDALGDRVELTARIADLDSMGVSYIHNKGLLIDGNLTLISSINWNKNAFTNNREAAVMITSPSVNNYYRNLFNQDWNASEPLVNPIVAENQPAVFECPKHVHLLINGIKLQITEAEDEDFNSLRHLRVDDDFVIQDEKHCTLMQINEKAFLQFKRTQQGVLSVIYEGYTPKTAKLFSMRAKERGGQVSGIHEAVIYDGSGPSNQKIGQAVLSIQTP